tara:strand:+ start:129 stop:239 length:111 start_codon:yes stop_codon:yes gene_type:complete
MQKYPYFYAKKGKGDKVSEKIKKQENQINITGTIKK